MESRRGHGPSDERRDEGRDGRQREGGPPGTDFLDLEISQVMYGEASGVAREAFRELLKDAVKARIKERFGAKIDALAKLAADELLDEVETNLSIEALINKRKETRRGREDALRRVFSQDEPEGNDR